MRKVNNVGMACEAAAVSQGDGGNTVEVNVSLGLHDSNPAITLRSEKKTLIFFFLHV